MDLSAIRILVVDDNRHAIEIVRSILGSVGAQRIVPATTAHDAFRLLGDQIDMLILDQNLGKGDEGIQLVRRIRNDPGSPNPYLPLLMLTGYADERRVTAARDAGVSEFLVKPFTVAGLLKRIEALILQPRPFVRSADYFGPDRRRRADPRYTGPERRQGG
ncbi:MAG: response regulator receiver protein [Phenylobacterium sp.]|nr:response regulator receiver protein [Phenylobacterium sp.]